ncbi:large subunit ribosomal protein L3 [Nitrosomonas sp. Nm51]|uniref:50S ribosomal protein L3 n=1 Tax=Nitrosomonas sp. Nm51 TaxID=133720 RepID=UPI0008C81800|nr:50S ribosomal protein L3 [Nitrosomonas sp. Nm51]SER60214.1 large subunit ribosomal protein L3 [Nitrosomonas sp. Nm51]
MSLGLIGRKVGMTRVFTENGTSLPVTVIDVSQNRVIQIKSKETDGYSAIQLAFGKKRAVRINKPLAGHYSKAGAEAGEIIKEFRLHSDEALGKLKNGAFIEIDIFQEGQKVDISGITIGKGYAGTIKRHNFSANRTTHGNSKAHRKPGSIGMAQDPGRIFPGKRMSGQMGNVRKTIQNLEIIRIDKEKNLLLIKGSFPGSKGGKVIIRPSVKVKQ